MERLAGGRSSTRDRYSIRGPHGIHVFENVITIVAISRPRFCGLRFSEENGAHLERRAAD
jgi:hypothetical protein